MDNKEPIEKTDLFEKNFWEGLIQNPEWKHFKTLLQSHKQYLEKQVLTYTSSRNFEKAFGVSERADECGKLLTLIENRLSEVRKG